MFHSRQEGRIKKKKLKQKLQLLFFFGLTNSLGSMKEEGPSHRQRKGEMGEVKIVINPGDLGMVTRVKREKRGLWVRGR